MRTIQVCMSFKLPAKTLMIDQSDYWAAEFFLKPPASTNISVCLCCRLKNSHTGGERRPSCPAKEQETSSPGEIQPL